MNDSTREKSKKILASLVMGINAVNVFAPMTQAVNQLNKFEGNIDIKPEKEIALDKAVSDEKAGYTTLSNIVEYVDDLVFNKAQAWTSNINGGSTAFYSMVAGDTMNITNGTGSVQYLLGGTQYISSAGFADVYIMSGGLQEVHENGFAQVEEIYGGTQIIHNNAVVTVVKVASGSQTVSSGGTLFFQETTSAYQTIEAGAYASGGAFSGAVQNVYGVADVDEIYGNATAIMGTQNIYSGGTGSVGEIIGKGTQYVYEGAVGHLDTINYGLQVVSGGKGYIKNLNDGYQVVYSGGVASAVIANGGEQIIQAYALGSIGTVSGGIWESTQHVSQNGTGHVGTMYEGEQLVNFGGTGYVTVHNNGDQYIDFNATGQIHTMNDGNQLMYGTGSIDVMYSGTQEVWVSGMGVISSMVDGIQIVSHVGTIINMTNGTQLGLNDVVVEYMSGGEQSVMFGTGAISSLLAGTQHISTFGTGTVEDMNGGEVHISGGTAAETVMNDGLILYHTASGEIKDLEMNGGRVLLNADSDTYKFTGTLKGNDGIIDMTEKHGTGVTRTFETITVDRLTGSGTIFKINTDLASEANSDKIIITVSDPGTTQYVQVVDESLFTGDMVTGIKTLLFATDASDNVTFQGLALDNGGLWEITPNVLQLDPNNWYLTNIVKEPNPSTETLIGNIESSYGLWRNIMTDDTLRNRLGDLRLDKEANGVWARVKAGNLEGQGYDSNRQMFQVGIDKTVGNNTYGFAIDHSNTSGSYVEGDGEGSMTGLSLYMTTYKDNGSYSDLVLRYGRLRSNMNSYGNVPDSFNFDTNGYSISYEFGKTIEHTNGWFIEPQIQLAYGHLGGGNYETERGVDVDRSAINSLLGRVGFNLGRRINESSDYYLKANFYREFLGKDTMDLLATNGERMNYVRENKGNWFELGIGGTHTLSKQTYVYGDVVKSFGGDIKKKWQVNAGIRFAFGGPKPATPLPAIPPMTPIVAPKHEEFLDTIYFDFDVDTPKAGEQVKIDNFVKVAKENPNRTYALVGHTDAIGTEEYNMELSKRRVENVKNIARNEGVPAAQMEETYQGKAEPADTDSTAEGRANNRRVNIFEYTNK